MATVSFYVRHLLKDERKVEELLEALNNPDVGIVVDVEEVKRALKELEEGEETLKEWIGRFLLSNG
jgi:hypothetical protein